MNFFKSVWFKCACCLLSIFLIAGGSLAILSNLLYVSPEERTTRALDKIYDFEITLSANDFILDVDGEDEEKKKEISTPYGEISKILKVDKDKEDNSYDLVFQATGNNGYKGGTITLWITVNYQNDLATKIDKVILESNTKQTLMSKLTGEFYDNFTDLSEDYKNGKIFTPDSDDKENIKNVVSGATMSANAGCNAVNAVIFYVWGNK
jgi:Na+-translocating ferredoxin:NAD+ oxidoreductase RnfG subunit